MTNDEIAPVRRETLTRRVEYRLPTDVEGLDYRAVVARLDAALRLRRTGTSPVRLRAEDDAVVVFYDETVTDPVDVANLLRTRQLELHDALGGRPDGAVAHWDDLVRAARRHARLAEVVSDAAARRGGDGYRDPVPALLPHDWSQRLGQFLPAAGNQLALLSLIRRAVGEWVLATEDVADDVGDVDDVSASSGS